MRKKTSFALILVILAVAIVFMYTQLTIFVVPPIGAVPEGTSSPASSPASPPFYLSSWKTDSYSGDQCEMSVFLYNASLKTIEAFAGEVTLHTVTGDTLATERFLIKWLDAKQGNSDNITLPDAVCVKLDTVRLRSITTCKIDGTYVSDCLAHVRINDGGHNI